MLKQTVNHLQNRIGYSLSKSFGPPELFYLKLTENCNFKCNHCNIWKQKSKDELDANNWENIINNLNTHHKPQHVVLSGGEPLMHPQFWHLISLLKNKNIGVTLNTNGSLITKSIAKKIIDHEINKVEISLYTLNSEKHDKMRNTQNAHSRASKAIEHLINYNQSTKKKTELMIAYLLSNNNIDETSNFIKEYSKKKVWTSIQSLDTNIQQLDQKNFFQNEDQFITDHPLWISDTEKVNAVFDKLIELKNKKHLIHNRLSHLQDMRKYYLGQFMAIKKMSCYAGQKNLIISANGDLFYCFKGPKLGNLNERTAKEILTSDHAENVLREMKKCSRLCSIMNCNYDATLTNKIKEYIKK